MWKNGLHVFVFALLSYLAGRPAVPRRLPKELGVSRLGLPEACGLKGVMTGRPSSLGTSAPSEHQVPGILASGTQLTGLQHTSACKNRFLTHIHQLGEVTSLASSTRKTDQLCVRPQRTGARLSTRKEAESLSRWGRVGKRHLEMVPSLLGGHCKNDS